MLVFHEAREFGLGKLRLETLARAESQLTREWSQLMRDIRHLSRRGHFDQFDHWRAATDRIGQPGLKVCSLGARRPVLHHELHLSPAANYLPPPDGSSRLIVASHTRSST